MPYTDKQMRLFYGVAKGNIKKVNLKKEQAKKIIKKYAKEYK